MLTIDKTTLVKEWPYNLMNDVIGNNVIYEDTFFNFSISSLYEVLNTLTESQQMAIKYRYIDKLTDIDIANVMRTTPFKVKRHIERSLKHIRHPKNMRKIECISIERYLELNERYYDLKNDFSNLLYKYNDALHKLNINDSSMYPIDKLSIEDLGLSTRAFVCLKRSGIHKVTDVINLTEQELREVRNLGNVTYNEIVSVLEKYGLYLKTE